MHHIVCITPLHHTFEIIIEQVLGNASQVRKRMEVTTNEPGGIRCSRKAHIAGSRPAQRHDEGVEPTGTSVMGDETEVPPIHLPLLSMSCLKADRARRFLFRASIMHKFAHLTFFARIALCQDFRIELAGVQHAFCYTSLQVGSVRIDFAWLRLALWLWWRKVRRSGDVPNGLAIPASPT